MDFVRKTQVEVNWAVTSSQSMLKSQCKQTRSKSVSRYTKFAKLRNMYQKQTNKIIDYVDAFYSIKISVEMHDVCQIFNKITKVNYKNHRLHECRKIDQNQDRNEKHESLLSRWSFLKMPWVQKIDLTIFLSIFFFNQYQNFSVSFSIWKLDYEIKWTGYMYLWIR